MSPSSAPEYIQKLSPYVPGKPIEETQREYGLKRVIKLASNENPLGPSPKAVRVLKAAEKSLNLYPDATAYHLKNALAKHLNEGTHARPNKVATNQITVGNGSNELIDLLIRSFSEPGDQMVTSDKAFIAYRICAQVHGVETLAAPLTEDYRFDLKAIADLARKNERVKFIFLANPNNPTGTHNTATEVRALCDALKTIRGGSVMLVLDYAYWEYVTAKDLPDAMKVREWYPNSVMLRTFSKIYGIAGLRVGYGVGPVDVMSVIEKTRMPFNLNSLAMEAAIAALTDTAFTKKAKALNVQGMKLWDQALKDMNVPHLPSQGNFLLCDTHAGFGKTGFEVFQNCLRRGVIFRPVSNYGFLDSVRVSIGTMEENKIAIQAILEEVPDLKLRAKLQKKYGKFDLSKMTGKKGSKR